MTETSEKTKLQVMQETILPKISTATDENILAYLRRSHKIAEIATLTEKDALIVSFCEQFNITVSDEEWQSAGNAFRQEHKLLGVPETVEWLSQQRITVEDWSEGIKIRLLEKKLQEHLFGSAIDNEYIKNRNLYKRIALSQILVDDLADAFKIARLLREENASFCALAIEYSKGKQSKENGGFVGIHFISELLPELRQAAVEAQSGEVIGPISTKIGHHVLRVEKWFSPKLDETGREKVLESLFQKWLQEYQSKFVEG